MHANVASLPHCTWLASRHATPRCTIQCTTGIRKAHDGLACRPKIEHELDLSNFDNEFTEAKPNFLDSVGGPGALGGSDTAFAGFTFKATDFSMMKVGIALFSPASPRRTCSVAVLAVLYEGGTTTSRARRVIRPFIIIRPFTRAVPPPATACCVQDAIRQVETSRAGPAATAASEEEQRVAKMRSSPPPKK